MRPIAKNHTNGSHVRRPSIQFASAIRRPLRGAEDILIGQCGMGTDIIVDRFSKATTGITRVIANSYVDVAIRRAASFSAMKDALTA